MPKALEGIRAREMLVNMPYPGVGTVPLPGIPAKLSETPGKKKPGHRAWVNTTKRYAVSCSSFQAKNWNL